MSKTKTPANRTPPPPRKTAAKPKPAMTVNERLIGRSFTPSGATRRD